MSSSSSSSSSLWLPDGSSDVCMLCKITFDILIRRHHCRKCGGIYCGGCCSNYMKLPMNLIVTAPGFDRATMDPSLPVRCCNKCKHSSIRPLPIQSDQQQQGTIITIIIIIIINTSSLSTHHHHHHQHHIIIINTSSLSSLIIMKI